MWNLPGWILRGYNMCDKIWILWNYWMLAKHHKKARIYEKAWPGTVKTKGSNANIKNAGMWKYLKKNLEYIKLRIVVGEIHIKKR